MVQFEVCEIRGGPSRTPGRPGGIRGPDRNDASRLDSCPRRARPQPPQYRRRSSERAAGGHYRALRIGQVVACLRHDLRRRAATLRRVAVGVRAAVPRADGEARRRSDRGAVAGDFHRAEDDGQQPAIDGRHGHRDLRLPAAAVRQYRHAALPELRPRDRQPVARADHRPGDDLSAGRAHQRAGADRPGTERRVQEGARAAVVTRGFTKARIDGQFKSLEDDIRLDRRKNHTIEVVVDRLVVRSGIERRLTESIETALQLAYEIVVINSLDEGDRLFSRRMACVNCGISVPELSPRAFSFNSPHGACPECQGLGATWDFDPARIVPDPAKIAGGRRDRAVGARRQEARRRRAGERCRRRSASISTRRSQSCRRSIGTCCCSGRPARPPWRRGRQHRPGAGKGPESAPRPTRSARTSKG